MDKKMTAILYQNYSHFLVRETGRRAKTVDNCFREAETAQSKESEKGYGPTIDDYATVVGNLQFPWYHSGEFYTRQSDGFPAKQKGKADRPCLLLYNENHAIVAWFNKGYCR
ncbi:MAG: hypothetical protein J6K14_06525 [Clostridia bacterium]|nr:hypothetical protein [Clostridia bacterium]